MARRLLYIFFFFVGFELSANASSILVLGDSLSAGYEIPVNHGWVSLLQERLASEGYDYKVVNASISGDTTAGALARVDSHIKDVNPEIAIVELGGNDGLRGLPITVMQENLGQIISRLHHNGVRVLLIPIRIPPNYGQIYTDKFWEVYQRLSTSHQVTLGRFLLDGIALDPELMMPDGIHPTAEAQPRVLDNVWTDLQPMLGRQATGSTP